MALRLVDDDLDVSLDIPVDPNVREALGIQMQRCSYTGTRLDFEFRLVERLVELIDADLRPPSYSQISFAIRVARTLNIALPGEALRFKGSMKNFLDRNVPLYKERTEKKLHGEED